MYDVDQAEELLTAHQHSSEHAIELRKLLALKLHADPLERAAAMAAEYTDRISLHFAYEEEHVFPALLAVCMTKDVQALVDELLAEHVLIARLWGPFALGDAPEDPAQFAQDVETAIQVLLDHAAKEDARLIPLLQEHDSAIRLWLRQREAEGAAD